MDSMTSQLPLWRKRQELWKRTTCDESDKRRRIHSRMALTWLFSEPKQIYTRKVFPRVPFTTRKLVSVLSLFFFPFFIACGAIPENCSMQKRDNNNEERTSYICQNPQNTTTEFGKCWEKKERKNKSLHKYLYMSKRAEGLTTCKLSVLSVQSECRAIQSRAVHWFLYDEDPDCHQGRWVIIREHSSPFWRLSLLSFNCIMGAPILHLGVFQKA